MDVSRLQDALLRLLREGHGDFSIKCKDEKGQTREFSVLASLVRKRSTVLDAMLSHNMQETQLMELQIDDVDAADVESLLQFMYTGDVMLTESNVSALQMLADKYDVPDLFVQCEKWLETELNDVTLARVLKDACHLEVHDLVERCLMLLDVNAPSVLASLHILPHDLLKRALSRKTLCMLDESMLEIIITWAQQKKLTTQHANECVSECVHIGGINHEQRHRLAREMSDAGLESVLVEQVRNAPTLNYFLSDGRRSDRHLVAPRAVQANVLEKLYSQFEAHTKSDPGYKDLPFESFWVTAFVSRPLMIPKASSKAYLDHARRGCSTIIYFEPGDSMTWFIMHWLVRPSAFRLVSSLPFTISASPNGCDWTVLIEDTLKCPHLDQDKTMKTCRSSQLFKWFRIDAKPSDAKGNANLQKFDVYGVLLSHQ